MNDLSVYYALPLSLLCLLVIAYSGFLYYLFWGFNAIKKVVKPHASPLLTVLLPARNEAGNIGVTLTALLGQSYPNFEIIFINDHSTDQTATIAGRFTDQRLRVLHLPGDQQGKKAALAYGIQHAKGDYIITTDADTVMIPSWLSAYASAWANGASLVLAPVCMTGPNTLLTAFQQLDVAGTMLLTAASTQQGHPLLANGANMGYPKAVFEQLGGYAGNEGQASGDDVFLLQKAAQAGLLGITFLRQPAAWIATPATPTWRALFWQRLRWAGKTSAYRDWRLVAFQGLVYLLSLLLIVAPITLFWYPAAWWIVALAWGSKFVADGLFLYYASRYFQQDKAMWWFIPVFVLHMVYIVVIGTLALLRVKSQWKGRRT